MSVGVGSSSYNIPLDARTVGPTDSTVVYRPFWAHPAKECYTPSAYKLVQRVAWERLLLQTLALWPSA